MLHEREGVLLMNVQREHVHSSFAELSEIFKNPSKEFFFGRDKTVLEFELTWHSPQKNVNLLKVPGLQTVTWHPH